MATAGLLAQIFTAKFVDGMPYYRQEKQFERLGYVLSRTNMANWTIQAGLKLVKLPGLLRHELLSGPLIHMDETTIQVLKEEGRSATSKSYMWVLRSGASKTPGVLFHYSPTRASKVAQDLLTSYQGVVQTDGYNGYDYLDESQEIDHAACWAHSRRKFMEVLKIKDNPPTKKTKTEHTAVAIDFIRHLYAISYVVGRKNWFFCDTVEGAKASAALYSLIETARANGLNPYEYLKLLFEKFPLVETDDALKALFPQYHHSTPPGEKQDGV